MAFFTKSRKFRIKGRCSWCNREKTLWIKVEALKAHILDYVIEATPQAFCSQRCFEKWMLSHAIAWCYQARNRLENPNEALIRLLKHRRLGKLLLETIAFAIKDGKLVVEV